jgi:O-antigen/teichoic acid export membrane protein
MIKNKRQPLFSMPGLFIVSISTSLLTIIIGDLYGMEVVGYYSISLTVLGLPIALIGSSVGKIFFKNASQEYNSTGQFYSTFKNTLLILIGGGMIPFAFLGVFSEQMFGFIFGQGWGISGVYIRYLLPWYFMVYLAGTMMTALIISGKQFLKLVLQSVFAVIVLFVYLLAKYTDMKIEMFLLNISVLFMFNYFILLYIIFRESKIVKV